MASYALIETNTNVILSLLSWRDKEIDIATYPVDPGFHIEKVDDELFLQANEKFLNGVGLKIKDQSAESYFDMFEEFEKPVETNEFITDQQRITTLETELTSAKAQNADLNLQVIDIWETLINGGVA